MNKIFLSVIAFIIITSCGKRIESSKSIHQEEAQPVYYLKNDLNSYFNLNGPVNALSTIFMRNDKNELFQNVLGLNIYPLPELIGYRGYKEFDKMGNIVFDYDYKDSLSFVKNKREARGAVRFYNKDSLPTGLTLNNSYNNYIIYPGLIKLNYAFETINPKREIINVVEDSLYRRIYSYSILKNKINTRKRRDVLSSGKKLPYYDERIDYVYDNLNRIIREDYSYYEILDDDGFPFTRSSHEYHNINVGGRDKMQQFFSYDSLGNIANVEMYINDNYVFEEKYQYNEKGNLISKERIDPRHKYHPYHRSYRMVYTFDKYGNITQLDAYDEEGELQEQLWVDYYEFDKYNNWRRCEMFLNNTHSGEPQLTGYRRITYYEG